MTLENLKLEKQRIMNAIKLAEDDITQEYKINGTKKKYYLFIKNRNDLRAELKKINSEIVKKIIVTDSFTFGSPI